MTGFIERFATVSRAPVRTGVTVTSVRRTDGGYHVTTSHGEIGCRAVVIASGAYNQPAVPQFKDAVPASVEQLTPFDYRDPAKLPDSGVLVAGASATGVQLAAELQRSGRPVTLSVGEHVRLGACSTRSTSGPRTHEPDAEVGPPRALRAHTRARLDAAAA